jgi:hypothetical protein
MVFPNVDILDGQGEWFTPLWTFVTVRGMVFPTVDIWDGEREWFTPLWTFGMVRGNGFPHCGHLGRRGFFSQLGVILFPIIDILGGGMVFGGGGNGYVMVDGYGWW